MGPHQLKQDTNKSLVLENANISPKPSEALIEQVKERAKADAATVPTVNRNARMRAFYILSGLVPPENEEEMAENLKITRTLEPKERISALKFLAEESTARKSLQDLEELGAYIFTQPEGSKDIRNQRVREINALRRQMTTEGTGWQEREDIQKEWEHTLKGIGKQMNAERASLSR